MALAYSSKQACVVVTTQRYHGKLEVDVWEHETQFLIQ